MGRQPCCDKVGLKRGPWTIEEDQKLMNFILNNGIQCWRLVPKLAGLLRCGKSCRLRWMNYLRPDLKRGALTEAEEDQIIELHSRLGNKWSKIAAHFPGRTDNEIKNHWNTRIRKKLKALGIDPKTHNPVKKDEKDSEAEDSSNSKEATNGTDAESKSEDDHIGKTENIVNPDGNFYKDLEEISHLTARTDKSESFSSSNLVQQNWIDNMDYLLGWDGFDSNLEELFPFDIQ